MAGSRFGRFPPAYAGMTLTYRVDSRFRGNDEDGNGRYRPWFPRKRECQR